MDFIYDREFNADKNPKKCFTTKCKSALKILKMR